MHHTSDRRIRVAALLVVGVVTLAQIVSADEGIFGPIRVAVNRHQYTGRNCPIEIIYTASINFVPHRTGVAFNYHWERSDGAKGPVRVVRVPPNQRATVVRETWRLGAPGKRYAASQTIFVNSGNTHLSETSATVNVVCQ